MTGTVELQPFDELVETLEEKSGLEKNMDKVALRSEVLHTLKSQGFLVNPHLALVTQEKNAVRKLHEQKKKEQLQLHKKSLLKNFNDIRKHSVNGWDLEPKKIDLELIEVNPNSPESAFFFWWNFVWWSLPYAHPVGRQLRFILWDRYHDAPFGLILLQSPPLRSSTRDHFLGLDQKNVDYWINQSMYAQRIGALPPYNSLLGAKMVALSLTSNKIREIYEKKYENRETLLKKRILPNKLLFITTTSAFGKSSVYERISFKGTTVSNFLGFTAGSGTFHIPEALYKKLLQFLKRKGYNVKRGYGTGPSRKLRLLNLAFRMLDLKNFSFHTIKRGYYLFSNISNLLGVINKNEKPQWYDRPFDELFVFWKKRWCIPRSARTNCWKNFNSTKYFNDVKNQLISL